MSRDPGHARLRRQAPGVSGPSRMTPTPRWLHRYAVVTAADVEALPFRSGAFDAVVGNAVLHHLRLDRAVPELLRVVRPGGAICFAEPNMLNPQVFLERNVRWIGRLLDNSPGETAFVRWRLRRELGGVAEVRSTSAKWAWVEYRMSQGGQDAGLAALAAWQNGGGFAAWAEAMREVDERGALAAARRFPLWEAAGMR